MINLTKEWLLKTIAELEEEHDATPGVVNVDAAMALAAMKLALASLEAEAMTQVLSSRAGNDTSTIDKALPEGTMLYTAPPSPVFVPDELTREEYKRRFMEDDDFDDTFRGGWKAHRAAMLQGAELVTTANKLPFEQWLSQQTGTIDVECGCVMTEVFFHWLRVAYEAGNYPVIPDGWVLVPIEPTYQMCEAMGLQWESPRFPDRYKAMLAAVKK